jgi:hypothetical protein
MRRLLLVAALLLFMPAAFAIEPDEMMKDSALEARARAERRRWSPATIAGVLEGGDGLNMTRVECRFGGWRWRSPAST